MLNNSPDHQDSANLPRGPASPVSYQQHPQEQMPYQQQMLHHVYQQQMLYLQHSQQHPQHRIQEDPIQEALERAVLAEAESLEDWQTGESLERAVFAAAENEKAVFLAEKESRRTEEEQKCREKTLEVIRHHAGRDKTLEVIRRHFSWQRYEETYVRSVGRERNAMRAFGKKKEGHPPPAQQPASAGPSSLTAAQQRTSLVVVHNMFGGGGQKSAGKGKIQEDIHIQDVKERNRPYCDRGVEEGRLPGACGQDEEPDEGSSSSIFLRA